MAFQTDIKSTFEASRVIQPIYTGGSVALSDDGTILATCLGDEALLTDLETGRHLCRIEGDGEAITTLSLAPDASWLVLCSRSLSLRIFALVLSGDGIDAKLARTLKPHSTPVVTSAIDSTSSLLATGSADGEIKVWDLRGGYTTHTFHGHSGVISALHFFRVEAEEPPVNTKKRKNKQRGEEGDNTRDEGTVGFRLASGGEDAMIRIWDLHKRKSIAILEAHASVVRSLEYSLEHALLLSGSRDGTALIWNAKNWRLQTTVPVLEATESAGFLQSGLLFYTGGENGRLRIWSTKSGAEVTEEQQAGVETEGIVGILHRPTLSFVLSVHADQTLLMHDLSPLKTLAAQPVPPLSILRRISGNHDEVIDLAYVGSQRNLLALATNSEDIRLISLDSEPSSQQASLYFGADVALLKGHEDIIITLDIDWSGHWLATGAKDNVARLWRLDPANDSYTCYATFTGHAESISAVALPSSTPPTGTKEFEDPLQHPPAYLITGSQDKTIKKWDIAKKTGVSSRSIYTRKAHDKDINAIETSFSTTAPLFASASQDRTVKIWDVEAGEAIGVLRGHKRGVWSVAFSPPKMPALTIGDSGGASSGKGMILTGSGDKSIKIWNLSDYSCLRTFEGHVNSILKVVWLPPPKEKNSRVRRGVQVASAAGDGLVKVWDAQTSECVATLDNHIDRVWALAVKPEPLGSLKRQIREKSTEPDSMDAEGEDAEDGSSTLELVSGSADSTLTFWIDTTETTAMQATTQASARIEQDQELQNHIRSHNYREAIVLALQLNHPKRLLDLFTAVVNGKHDVGSFTGRLEIDEVLATLSDSQLWSLLRRVRDWNANGRTHNVAQHILYAILRLNSKDRLLSLRRRRRNARSVEDENAENELTDALSTLSTHEKIREKESVKDVVDGLRAYTERHCTRLERTSEERFVLTWALQQMDAVSGEVVSDGLVNGYHNKDAIMLDSGL